MNVAAPWIRKESKHGVRVRRDQVREAAGHAGGETPKYLDLGCATARTSPRPPTRSVCPNAPGRSGATAGHAPPVATSGRSWTGTVAAWTSPRPPAPGCLCSISCCGSGHDDFSGLGRACRPRNGLNWMVLVSPPERTGKDYDQHAPSTVYPSFAAERGIRRVDRAENTCQRADGA